MKPLSRRALLRGLAGTALALPLLEAMGSRITTVTTPRRYVLVFGGFSLGTDGATGGAGGAAGNLVLPRGDEHQGVHGGELHGPECSVG